MMQSLNTPIVCALALSLIVGALAAGCTALPPSAAPGPTPAASPAESPVVVLAKNDLAGRIGVAVTDIRTRSVEAVNWPDASLGCPQPGMMYAQVVTPGQRIVLEAGGQIYEYHSDEKNVVLCSRQKK